MTYVDPLQACVPTDSWRWPFYSHLAADTLGELHEFAKRLGMRKRWFQGGHDGKPHYDLTPSRRSLAVQLGAKEVTSRELLAVVKQCRRV